MADPLAMETESTAPAAVLPPDVRTLSDVWRALLERSALTNAEATFRTHFQELEPDKVGRGRNLPLMIMTPLNLAVMISSFSHHIDYDPEDFPNGSLEQLADPRILSNMNISVPLLPADADNFRKTALGENATVRDTFQVETLEDDDAALQRSSERDVLVTGELRRISDAYNAFRAAEANEYDFPKFMYVTLGYAPRLNQALPRGLYFLVAPNGMAALIPDGVAADGQRRWRVQRAFIIVADAAEMETFMYDRDWSQSGHEYVYSASGMLRGRECVPSITANNIPMRVTQNVVELRARHSTAGYSYLGIGDFHAETDTTNMWEQRVEVDPELWAYAHPKEVAAREAEMAARRGPVSGGRRHIVAPPPFFMSIKCQLFLLGDHNDVMRPDMYWARRLARDAYALPRYWDENVDMRLHNAGIPIVHRPEQ